MEKKKKTYPHHRRWKWLLITLGLVVVMVIGFRIAIQSDWVFDKIRDIGLQQVNKQLNGTIEVESIRGNLLDGFTIHQLKLSNENGKSVFEADSVTVQYRFLDLIRTPYRIDHLHIVGGKAYLIQESDSTWNVMTLLKERRLPEDDPGFESIHWQVDQVQISDLELDIRSEYLFPDEYLRIAQMDAQFSAGQKASGFYGTLSSLEFDLHEARLPQEIEVGISGDYADDRVTLETLVFNTGRSLLSGSVSMVNTEQIRADLALSPLSWNDLALYTEEIPLKQNLNIALHAAGNFNDLILGIIVQSEGLERFELSVNLQPKNAFLMNSFNMEIDQLNLPVLTEIDEWPIIEYIRVDGDGQFMANTIKETIWEGNAVVTGFMMDEYRFDQLEIGYDLNAGELNAVAQLGYLEQHVDLTTKILNVFDDQSEWMVQLNSTDLNLAGWFSNVEMDLESELNLMADLYGSGLSRETFNMAGSIDITESRFGDQPFNQILLNGELNRYGITGTLDAELSQSRLESRFEIKNLGELPDYEFAAKLIQFNAAELTGFENFPTYINGHIEGEGSGFEVEQMMMNAIAVIDSSVINSEEFEMFMAEFRIADQYLFIDEGLLESPIADASFTLQHHLTNFLDSENRLNFNASLKDLYPLAPLFGRERLESEGVISGTMERNPNGILEFNGELDLENIAIDALFNAEKIVGMVNALIMDQSEIELQLNIQSPEVYDMKVQDMIISSTARLEDDSTISGILDFQLMNGGQSSLQQSGSYSIRPDDIRMITSTLIFESAQRTLSLTQPFELQYKNEVFRSDTLSISTDNRDAWLSLWIPHLDSLQQHISLDAENLNVGLLQRTFMENGFFEGYLSGSVEWMNSSEDLLVSATGRLNQFEFEGGEMDSIRFNLSIEDEWLDAGVNSWHLDKQLIAATLRVPYLPGDPFTFDDQIFERDVTGSLRLMDSELRYWLSFMPDGVPEQTEGLISIELDLQGIAGSPGLVGNLTVDNGIFSGIGIDQLSVDLNYLHDERETDLNGFVTKDGKQVLEFDSKLPFLVDLKRAKVILPSDQDEIFTNLTTSDFDLGMINNYLNPLRFRNVAGRLNGNLRISGELSDMQIIGDMNLTGGSMQVVPAGITLGGIRSTINFEPGRINLQQFSMNSGPGSFQANGFVELDNLTPNDIDIEYRANQFRLANTSEYNAVVNSRARFTGTFEDPRLIGNLSFLNGFVNLQNFGDRAVETVTLDDEEEPEPLPFYENLTMEMDVSFNRQFLIRNRQYLDMEIEIGGQLDLLKEKNEEIQMFGTLEGVRGYARPLGKNFELNEAILSFSGPVDNPQINIVTQHEPIQAVGVTIFYIIDGSLQDPEFRFDSTPEMELQDIISYTLFGKPFYNLESWEQVVAGSGGSPSAADYALDVLLDRVEMLASQRLGIDVVQIDNIRSGSSNTTSIKTGWYLNRRTFFAILNEVGGSRPKTLFLLEYLLTENLELIIMQGDDSREGVDLRWKLDY